MPRRLGAAAPQIAAKVDFARLDSSEIRIYQNIGGAELRGAIELVSPGNKDRAGSRLTFAAKCAGYLKHGIGLVIVDVVTARTANLHAEIFEDAGSEKSPRRLGIGDRPVRRGVPGRDAPQEPAHGSMAGAACAWAKPCR